MRRWFYGVTYRLLGGLWYGDLSYHCIGWCESPWAHVNGYIRSLKEPPVVR